MSTEIKAFLNKISELAGGFEVTKEMIEETKSFLEKKDKKEGKKTGKDKKDPNAPKKPTNAYMIYAKEMRAEIVKDSDIKDAKDIIREIARRWNEEKKNNSVVYKQYVQKLSDAKDKYTSEMEDYIPNEKENEKNEKKEKKEKKDPNAPKKPTNAYMIYAKEMRQVISKEADISDAKELVREIARRWNEEKKNDSDIYKEYTQKLINAKDKYAEKVNETVPSKKVEEDEDEVPEPPKKAVKKVVPSKKVEEDEDEVPEPPKKAVKKVVPSKKVEEDEDEVPEPPKKAVKKVVPSKKVEEDEDEVPEPPKKAVKKVEEDEDEVPEPPKKAVKKNAKK